MLKKLLLLCLLALGIWCSGANTLVPRQRYRLDFEVMARGEVYPESWRQLGVAANYPRMALFFYDANRKRLHPMMPQCTWYVDSKGYTKGYFEFYAPDKAASYRLQHYGTRVRNVKLTPVKTGKNSAIPLHRRRSGGFRRGQVTPVGNEGKALYDISFGGFNGDVFPVKPGEKYRMTVYGGPGFKGSGLVIRVGFFRTSNSQKSGIKAGGNRMRIGKRSKSFTYELIVPPGANWMRMSCMWGQLHDYTFEKL